MRVLIFTTQLHQVGGHERLAVELAEDLNRLGTRADILSQYASDIPGVSATAVRLRNAGVPATQYLGLRPNPSGLSIIMAIKRLRVLVKTSQYDVVETSGFTPTLIASLGLLGLRCRHVAGIHLNYSTQRHRRLRHRILRALLRRIKGIKFYAISHAVREQWLEYSGTDPSRTEVVVNAVNRLYFDPPTEVSGVKKELGLDSDAIVLLFVGRLLKSKGVDTLIRAAASVLRDSDRYLLIVGRKDNSESAGDARMLNDIHAMLNRKSWGSRVLFLGHRSDVPALMAASSVLVHPARDEGFGLVLAEALAVGLPVVASDVGGISEVLAGTDSLLIPPDDSNALAQAIETVLTWSPEARAASIRKGKARAEDFRGAKRAAAMRRLYGQLLEDRV